MDVKLNSMNNLYHKTPNGVSKVSAKYNSTEFKSNSIAPELRTDKSDKVSISNAATQKYEIHRITKSIMKDIDAVDMDKKVEDIKARIENNTYEVSSDKIADAILSRWSL